MITKTKTEGEHTLQAQPATRGGRIANCLAVQNTHRASLNPVPLEVSCQSRRLCLLHTYCVSCFVCRTAECEHKFCRAHDLGEGKTRESLKSAPHLINQLAKTRQVVCVYMLLHSF